MPECEANFPEAEDWQGWIDLWCRDDTGNADCVPDLLLAKIADQLTPEGYLRKPIVPLHTPYRLARYSHRGPQPPWSGWGTRPSVVKAAWEEALADLAAKAEREEAVENPPLQSEVKADLYFIQSGEDGPIKIGVTGGPIEKRLKQLQTAHPYRLRVLCVLRERALDEAVFHERFAQHRLEGEWFSPHEDILEEITRLTTPPTEL